MDVNSAALEEREQEELNARLMASSSALLAVKESRDATRSPEGSDDVKNPVCFKLWCGARKDHDQRTTNNRPERVVT
jgi:hypothetical protein